MDKPIKLPPLPAGRWITDAGRERRAFFGTEVEAYARLAVEQATAELRAERDALLALLTTAGLARAQEEHNKVRAERDELRALLLRIRAWDMIDASANGAFWRRKIDAAVKEAPDADA